MGSGTVMPVLASFLRWLDQIRRIVLWAVDLAAGGISLHKTLRAGFGHHRNGLGWDDVKTERKIELVFRPEMFPYFRLDSI